MKLLICFLFSMKIFAFKFSPMTLNITPTIDKSGVIYLENDGQNPIAIQVTILTREMSEDGMESNLPIKGEFELFPDQLIIPAFEKRAVKINWKGENISDVENAYRIIAEQLPINLQKDEKKGNVKILLKYIGALYVNSEKSISEINLKKFESDNAKLIFKLENNGTKHQVLSNLKLIFSKKDNKKSIEVGQDDLKDFAGENVLAKHQRTFTLLKLGPVKDIDSTYQVKLNFDHN